MRLLGMKYQKERPVQSRGLYSLRCMAMNHRRYIGCTVGRSGGSSDNLPMELLCDCPPAINKFLFAAQSTTIGRKATRWTFAFVPLNEKTHVIPTVA